MRTLRVRVPDPVPRPPIAISDDDPLFLWESRRERFLVLHEFGYRWRPRLRRWDRPKVPRQRYRVEAIA